jgi:triosephosphate isomerase
MGQPDVDGALVGGASLEARSFADIIKIDSKQDSYGFC